MSNIAGKIVPSSPFLTPSSIGWALVIASDATQNAEIPGSAQENSYLVQVGALFALMGAKKELVNPRDLESLKIVVTAAMDCMKAHELLEASDDHAIGAGTDLFYWCGSRVDGWRDCFKWYEIANNARAYAKHFFHDFDLAELERDPLFCLEVSLIEKASKEDRAWAVERLACIDDESSWWSNSPNFWGVQDVLHQIINR